MGAVGLVLLMVAFAGESALLMEEVGKKKKLKSKPKPKRRADDRFQVQQMSCLI
jgi:hypothetical protein